MTAKLRSSQQAKFLVDDVAPFVLWLHAPKRPLSLVLGPGLLAATALEHADLAAIYGIEHGSKERGLVAAMTAHPDRIGFEAGKDLVFEFIILAW
jgi:hypothetical protein